MRRGLVVWEDLMLHQPRGRHKAEVSHYVMNTLHMLFKCDYGTSCSNENAEARGRSTGV